MPQRELFTNEPASHRPYLVETLAKPASRCTREHSEGDPCNGPAFYVVACPFVTMGGPPFYRGTKGYQDFAFCRHHADAELAKPAHRLADMEYDESAPVDHRPLPSSYLT